MKYIFKTSLLFYVFILNSCNTQDKLKAEENKRVFMNYSQSQFSSRCELLAVKYSIDTTKVRRVLAAYLKNNQYTEFCILTKGEVSESDKEKAMESSISPELSMTQLIYDVAAKNNLGDNVTASILFDYIILESNDYSE